MAEKTVLGPNFDKLWDGWAGARRAGRSGFAPAIAGLVEIGSGISRREKMDFPFGKVDRDLVKFAQHVHPEQQGRLVAQTEALERRRIGEGHQQTGEAGAADPEFADPAKFDPQSLSR